MTLGCRISYKNTRKQNLHCDVSMSGTISVTPHSSYTYDNLIMSHFWTHKFLNRIELICI